MNRRRFFSPACTVVSPPAPCAYYDPRVDRPRPSASRLSALLFIIVFSLLFLLIQTSPAAGVVLTVTAGYDGYVVPGRWAPLVIEVTGAMDGWVQIARLRQGLPVVTEEYRCRVEDESWRLLIPVFAEETGSRLEVRLVEGGKVLGRVEVNLLEKVFPGHLILTVNLPARYQQAVGPALSSSGPVLSAAYGYEPVLVIPVEFSALPVSALAYDGVSALLVSGDLAVLNPLQAQALRSWLAGGGSLLLFSTQGGTEAEMAGGEGEFWRGPAGIHIGETAREATGKTTRETTGETAGETAGKRTGDTPGETEEGWKIRRYGRGRIIYPRVQEGNNGRPATVAEWQRLLALEPYPRPFRLTPGLVFREGEIPWFFEEDEGITLGPLAAMLALWFLGGLAVVGFLGRKRTVVALLAYVAATTLLAVPAGKWIAGHWQRGAVVYTRAVLLPEDAGVLIDTVIKFPEPTWKTPVSPWGITLALGETAAGAVNREGTGETLWRHESLQPLMVVKEGDAKGLHLTGVLPPGAGPASMDVRAHDKTGPDRAVQLATRRPAGEDTAVQTPAGLAPAGLVSREPWLAVLEAFFPEEQLAVGYGDFPGFTLIMENGRKNPVLWAEPKSALEGLP